MNRKIYVASALENAKICQDLANHLVAQSHQIVSSWHYGATDMRASDSALSDEEREKAATIAHQNLMRANTLVVLYDERCRSTLYEIGVCYASGHRVVIVGSRSSVPTMIAQHGIVFVATSAEIEKYL